MWKLCFLLLFGVTISPGKQVPEHNLIVVEYDTKVEVDGESIRSTCQVLGLVDGRFSVVSSITFAGPEKSTLVFTGPPGEYAVLGSEGGASFTEIVQITESVPPGPGPPPNPPAPDPSLRGRSKKAYELMRDLKVGKEVVSRIANTLETVSSSIAAGGLKTSEEVRAVLRERNKGLPIQVKPFFDWLSNELNSLPDKRDVQQVKVVFDEVVIGLKVVGCGV